MAGAAASLPEQWKEPRPHTVSCFLPCSAVALMLTVNLVHLQQLRSHALGVCGENFQRGLVEEGKPTPTVGGTTPQTVVLGRRTAFSSLCCLVCPSVSKALTTRPSFLPV